MGENDALNFYLALQAILLVYIIASSIFFWCRRHQNRSIRAFSHVCAAASVWGTGQFLSACVTLYYPTETAFFWVNKLIYAGMCAMGPTVLRLAWIYCGKYKLYANRRLIVIVSAVAAAFWLVILTDPLHHLYYRSFSISGREYAPLMYLFTALSYLCFIYSGSAVILWHRERHPKYIKSFLLCYSLPLLANTLDMFIRDARYDLTVVSLSFLITGAYSLVYRHRAVNLSPIASQKILADLGYPVYVLSGSGGVLFENAAAKGVPGLMERYENQDKETVIPENGKVYKPRLTVLPDGNKLLAFTDITRYSEMLTELNRQSLELRRLQAELAKQMKAAKSYAAIAETYAIQRSRWEIAGKLNSQIYVVINQILENSAKALAAETSETEALQKNIDLTVEGIRMVRAIVSEYKEARRYGL